MWATSFFPVGSVTVESDAVADRGGIMVPTQLIALALVIALMIFTWWRTILRLVCFLLVLAVVLGVVTVVNAIQGRM